MKARGTAIVAASAVVAATAMYALTREGLRLHDWLVHVMPLPEHPISVPEPLRNVLPDALWQFAFCLCVFSMWRGATNSTVARVCIAAPVVIGLGTELGQAVGLIEGVFDHRDLGAMLLATVVAAVVAWRPSSPEQRENNGRVSASASYGTRSTHVGIPT